ARDGRLSPRTLFTMSALNNFSIGPDGSIYADQFEYPATIVTFSEHGGPVRTIANIRNAVGLSSASMNSVALLPDGRIAFAQSLAGRVRLMAVTEGREPVQLIPNTSEDTTVPVTVVGSREVALLVGPDPRRTIGVAAIDSGRIIRRPPFDKGDIRSLAASPDASPLSLAAGGGIWSLPAAGGEPRKIRAGTSATIDPTGRHLLVQVVEAPKTRLL